MNCPVDFPTRIPWLTFHQTMSGPWEHTCTTPLPRRPAYANAVPKERNGARKHSVKSSVGLSCATLAHRTSWLAAPIQIARRGARRADKLFPSRTTSPHGSALDGYWAALYIPVPAAQSFFFEFPTSSRQTRTYSILQERGTCRDYSTCFPVGLLPPTMQTAVV